MDKLFGRAGRHRPVTPTLAPDDQDRLVNALKLYSGAEPDFSAALRKLGREWIDDGESLKLRTVLLLVADLVEQGWLIRPAPDHFIFEPPGLAQRGEESILEVKARVQRKLRITRDRQLQEPSVRQFITRMERPVARNGLAPSSIGDLVDSGSALVADLARVRALAPDKQSEGLRKVVDPVLEVCEPGARCSVTGFRLIDIWRYFRHTWSHEYRSVPGRQMMVLVRNAARPNRPVMGIAMLASPVMRLNARDEWIGWLRPAAQTLVETGEWDSKVFARAIAARLEASIGEVRWDDLATAAEIARPTEAVVYRLQQKAYGAAYQRELALKERYEKGGETARREGLRPSADVDWRSASEDLLFVRKRAESLSELLFARLVLVEHGLKRPTINGVAALFASKRGQRAIDIVLAEFRKAGLSSRVADVSVCGAVHPYNDLLGGKLVAMLLTSRELRDSYARRYGGHVSLIASQMAGRPIVKPASLKILTTTSLYGLGSSQYNRLALRAAEHRGIPFDLKWNSIAKSGGYGTLHLGSETLQALRQMAEQRHDARRINNRFGEGTSPRLRQIREGLDALGIESDLILHHATPRIFYGCELEPGACRSLLSVSERAKARTPSVAAIGAAWRRRWLLGRISNRQVDVLERTAALGWHSIREVLHPDAELADVDQFEMFE